MLQIEMVQVCHKPVKILMCRIGQQPPVLFPLLIPLPEMADLISHEVELLPGVGVHIHIECPRLGELHLIVSEHFLEDGRLSVDDFIVGEREQVVGVVVVGHGKGEFVIAAAAEQRIRAEIIQRIVHPPHVPLVVKAKPAVLRRFGDARETGGVLGGQDGGRVELLKAPVHVLQKFYCI